MEKIIFKKTKSEISGLGIYQIIGGAIGIVVVIWALLNNQQYSTTVFLLYLVIAAFFTFSIYCGILCIKQHNNVLKFSLLNQALQLISFALLGFAFKYVAGAYLDIGMDFATWDFSFKIGLSAVEINVNSDPDRLQFMFNFVALAMLLWIDRLMKKVKREREIREIAALDFNNNDL